MGTATTAARSADRSDNDLKYTLNAAIEEIESLRRRNDLLASKAEAFDAIKSILGLMPNRGLMGYAPDITHTLRAHLHLLDIPTEPEPTPEPEVFDLTTGRKMEASADAADTRE